MWGLRISEMQGRVMTLPFASAVIDNPADILGAVLGNGWEE